MPLPPPRKPSPNLHSPRPAAPSLESVLALVVGASSTAELDAALRTARAHYGGRMLEQFEEAGAERARYLLETISEGGGDA